MVEKISGATKKLIPIVLVLLILSISFSIIAYGRGWRVDIKKREVKPTGLISIKSQPSGAQVLVDGKLTTATDNAFNIDPGWYTIRMVKEGYVPWEKKVRVQGEVAIKIDTSLFPANPNLSPLTTTGVFQPTLAPDGTKIAYIIPAKSSEATSGSAGEGLAQPGPSYIQKKSGLWTLEMSESPLGRNRDPQQLTASDELLASPVVTLFWSPDSRELLIATAAKAHLYTIGKPQVFADVTATLPALMSDWHTDRVIKEKQKLAGFSQEIVSMASTSAKILSFSPDETKILYEATASVTIPIIINPPLIGSNPTTEMRLVTPGKLYVYDSKEDKNFFVGDSKEIRSTKSEARNIVQNSNVSNSKQFRISNFEFRISNPPAGEPVWFPTSNHLVYTQNGKIDIMEYDGTNRVTVYAGPFIEGFLAPWPSGNSLVIVTNLNPGPNTLPNLYTVNLR